MPLGGQSREGESTGGERQPEYFITLQHQDLWHQSVTRQLSRPLTWRHRLCLWHRAKGPNAELNYLGSKREIVSKKGLKYKKFDPLT
jgi:hypothetical protein